MTLDLTSSPAPDALDFDPAVVLRWYVDAGVDHLVEESPQTFYDLPTRPTPGRPEKSVAPEYPPVAPGRSLTSPSPPPARSVVGPARSAVGPMVLTDTRRDAAHLAAQADSLEALQAALNDFTACPLRRTATNTVFADGNPASGVMIIGEAPGAEEDRLGRPFVGASGKLLDSMLASIGLDRRTCYITNVVFWRPPGNRKPTPDELALCVPFLERHIALVAPRAILAMGGLAAQTLLARNEGITRLRGKWGDYDMPTLSRPVPTLPTFHPAYLLRTPEQKRLAWRDLLAFQARLNDASKTGDLPVP